MQEHEVKELMAHVQKIGKVERGMIRKLYRFTLNCANVAGEISMSDAEMDYMADILENVMTPSGCSHCEGTGEGGYNAHHDYFMRCQFCDGTGKAKIHSENTDERNAEKDG